MVGRRPGREWGWGSPWGGEGEGGSSSEGTRLRDTMRGEQRCRP